MNMGGFYISNGHIVLNSIRVDSEDERGMISQNIVNSKSINLSPFKQIRLTCESNYGNGNDRWQGRVGILISDTAKKTIKSRVWSQLFIYPDVLLSFDVSTINQQAFIYISAESRMDTSNPNGDMWIHKIEFLT